MATTTGKYRPDIDGLRAVAVLSVLGFHAQLPFFTGGFIGVDVFFVISGYLISGIIFEHLTFNDFSFRDFYIRRINRIFPALIVVLVATALLGWTFLFRGELETLGKHITGGSVYGSNVLLWTESGYFDSPLKPLLHLWSLAVEEQFYLFFPLAAVLAWKARWNMRWLLGTAIAVSFALNIVSIQTNHTTAAFYMPHTRIWEILAGGFLATLKPGFAPVRGDSISLASIGALVFCVMLMDESMAWPGFWALIPVGATAIIIGAGAGSTTNRLLATAPMVYVGKISYPLYLWHWPLLVFARLVNERDLPVVARLGILALSFALAHATYRIIESPVRNGKRKSRSAIRLVPALGALGVVGAALAVGLIPPRLDLSKKKSIAEIGADWDAPRGGSIQKPEGFLVYRTQGEANRTVLLIGDSHAQQYWPRFVKAAKSHGAAPRLELAAYAGCPPLPNVNRTGKSWEEREWNCPAFYRTAMARAQDPDVESVVLAGFWEKDFVAENDARVFAQFERDLALLTSRGKRVSIVLSNPTFTDREAAAGPPRRLAGFIGKNVPPVIERAKFVARVAPLMQRLRDAASRAGATIIDPVDFLCDRDECATVTPEGMPVYRDGDHLRAGYVVKHVDFPDRLLSTPLIASSAR